MRCKPLSCLITAILTFACISKAQTAERYLVMEGTTAEIHVFNVSDDTEVAIIKAGAKPSSAAISGNGRLAFVANLNSEHISVLDLTIEAEIKPIRIVRFPQLALSPDGTTIAGADIDDCKLKLIDAASFNITKEIDLSNQFGDNSTAFCALSFGTPVFVGNSLYLNTGFGVGAVDLTSGTVSLVGGSGQGRFDFNQNLTGTMDGKFVVATQSPGLQIIDPVSNAVVRTLNGFFVCVSASNNPSTPDVVFTIRNSASGAVFSAIDVSTGQILGDVAVPGPFLDTRSAIASNGDSTRAYLGAT